MEIDDASLADDVSPASFGRCTVAPWVIASRDFQDHPRPIHLVGVRRENRALFARLARIDDPVERARVFDDYTNVKFHLHEWRDHTKSAGRALRNSYVRFLRGWGVDSGTIEAAVLKGWVESRLGLAPNFHRGRVRRGTTSYLEFARDRMRGSSRTSAIDAQLDLLFEFCQYELGRRAIDHLVLYRGTNDADLHEVLATRGRGEWLVRLNNLVSFTSDVERAWEFGSTVWEVRVPAPRIFYFESLLPRSVLVGEKEHLVFGGEHWVKRIA